MTITDRRRPTAVAATTRGPVEYRLSGSGQRTIIVFHAGHLSAAVSLGENTLARLGYRVLTVSRPGYGRTPLEAGPTREIFGETVVEVARMLGLPGPYDVVGQSHGGLTAMVFAATQPGAVHRLVLESSPSSRHWPPRWTTVLSMIAFNRATMGLTAAGLDVAARSAPVAVTRLLAPLTTMSVREVVADLRPGEAELLLGLFATMRGGAGLHRDLHEPVEPGLEGHIECPTLIIASRYDRQVPAAHARRLRDTIPDATLVWSGAPSHLIWFGSSAPDRNLAVRRFLGRHEQTHIRPVGADPTRLSGIPTTGAVASTPGAHERRGPTP